DGWVMPERDGYAVDSAALRKLLLLINQARRIEAKTANPTRYARLGVNDPLIDAAASGVRLDISAAGETMSLIVGGNRPGGTGTYVRRLDEGRSWLTDRTIAVEKRPARWLQRQLSDIAASRILSVTVEHPANDDARADTVRIESDGRSGFTLANLPAGREPADSYVSEALAGFLTDLRFDDLATDVAKPVPDAGVGRAEFRSRDGLVIDIRYWVAGEQPQRVWSTFTVDVDEDQAAKGADAAQARAKAEYDAALIDSRQKQATDTGADSASADAAVAAAADPGTSRPASETGSAAAEPPEAPLAVTDPVADRQARMAAINAEAEAMRHRVEGRAFELPTFKASNLRKRLDAYLKPASD
ncbi:MAG: DUF4340 domain-containing protein, partial [Xanthomonadales bacterium]|nr:DUF4340 domain-containing protein [Xanthomonadales bacterium]